MRNDKTISRTGEMRAFTLIELLVVISIIGVLAGLLIPLSGIATTKMRISRVATELNSYVTAIENYKLEVGSYPPDNGKLRQIANDPVAYKTNAALNPLFYELTGAVYTNGEFRTVAGSEAIKSADLQTFFKRDGIANSARGRFEVPYKGFQPKPSQYSEIASPGADIELLAVPVVGPAFIQGKTKKINPWYYDASTTNRHNRETFDLWAEILVSGKTNIIGNWKI